MVSFLLAETIFAFSDGPSSGPGKSARGFVVNQECKLVGSGSGPLPGAEVFDAEIIGTMKALEATVVVAEGLPIYILLNIKAATRALGRERSNFSQVVLDKFSSLRHIKCVEIRWIPGHMGIQGNIEADKLAKSALGALNNRSLNSATPIGEDQNLTVGILGWHLCHKLSVAVITIGG